MKPRLSARLLMVSDLARSVHFYESVFGLTVLKKFQGSGPELDAVCQLRDVSVTAVVLADEAGNGIELATFRNPPMLPHVQQRALESLGPTHLMFEVSDPDEMSVRVELAGGQVLTDTRVAFHAEGTDLKGAVFINDPDGVFIELTHGSAPTRFQWTGLGVTDIPAAISYYRHLGFEAAERYYHLEPLDWLSKLNRCEGIRLEVCVLRNDEGRALELVQVLGPESPIAKKARLDRVGLANLIFEVDDLDEVSAALIAAGGSMDANTRVVIPFESAQYEHFHGHDPFGAPVELLMRLTAGVRLGEAPPSGVS